MLLYGDLLALDAALAGANPSQSADYWAQVEKLSRCLRQSWLRVSDPIDLNDAPVEMAVGWVGGAPVAVVATAPGDIGLLHLTQGLTEDGEPRCIAEGKRFRMHGFDANTDEVRNILLSPRRHSREVDVFITVRRWPQSGGKPSYHLWRCILWRDGEDENGAHSFRTVVERPSPDRSSWLEVELPNLDGDGEGTHQFLDCACNIPMQWSVDDALSSRMQPDKDHGEHTALLLALSNNARARLDVHGKLSWLHVDVNGNATGPALEIEPPEPPVAMALSDDGRHLVVASANGRLLRYDVNGAQEQHDLEAGVAVLAVVPEASRSGSKTQPEGADERPLEILVAHRGGRVARWRWVGGKRLSDAWKDIVAERCGALPRAEDWMAWIDASPDRQAAECRQLLWLYAAWRLPELLDGFCDPSHARGKYSIGVRIGRELLALLHEHKGADSRQRALRVYNAGGLALREQVDRATLPRAPDDQGEDEFWHRSRTNYWDYGEGVASAVDPSMRRTAIGNLATRPYLYEACWRPGARFVGAMSVDGADGASNHLVIALGKELGSLAVPSADARISEDLRNRDSPLDDIQRIDEPELPLPWKWIRSLHCGGLRHAVMLGGRGGMVLVRPNCLPSPQAPLMAQVVRCHPEEEGLTAINLKTPSRDRLHLGLVWARGPRVRVQPWAIDLRAAHVAAPDDSGHEVPVAARMLDVAEIDGTLWMAAGTRLPRLEWLRFDRTKGPPGEWLRVENSSMRLKSAVVSLRFATGWVDGAEAPVLVFSTQAGWVWCVDARSRRALWLRQVGDSITVLDVSGHGEALRILVCAAPHWWCLFDAQGRRLWRHQIGPRVADAVMLPNAASAADPLAAPRAEAGTRALTPTERAAALSPGRLALIDADGGLSIFRNAGARWPTWRWRATELPEHDAKDSDHDRILAARCIADGRYTDAVTFQRPEPRRAVLAEAVASGAHLDDLLRLPDIKPDDIAAMARELGADRPIADWEALWQHALRLFDDEDASPAHGEMLAELLACLHRRRIPADFLTARLADLRRRSRSAAPQALRDHREAAVQAAHAWIDAISGASAPDSETVLRELHRLPPEAAYALAPILPPGRLAGWLRALAWTALQGKANLSLDVFADELRAADAEGGKVDSPTQAALEAALRLATCDQSDLWDAVCGLLAASRQVKTSRGVVIAALRQPGAEAPHGLPLDTLPLDRQRRWLVQALDRHWPALQANDEIESPDWSKAICALMAVVEKRYRRSLEKQEAAVMARSRPHLETKVLRWTGDEALLALRISHDGQRVLLRPHITITVIGAGDKSDVTPVVRWSWNPMQLAPGDPVHEVRLPLIPPHGQRRLRLKLTCQSGRSEDITEWPLDLGEPWHDSERISPLLCPPLLGDLVHSIQALSGGVATLVLDSPLAPEDVVRALASAHGMAVSDLDAALSILGPGRAYPHDLDLPAILRAIDGHPPRDMRMVYSQTYQPERWPHGGNAPLLIYPCTDLVRRLLDEVALESTRIALCAGLRARAQQRAAPSWVWVLPSGLAARWHAALADGGADLLHPAYLAPAALDDASHLQALAAHLGTDERGARQAVIEACHDLRLLDIAATRREAARLAWVRADLSGLEARELVAVVALFGARVQLPLRRIPAAATADETVISMAAGPHGAGRVLVSAGDVGFDIRRLRSVRKDLLVRGIVSAEELGAMSAVDRRMLELIGFDAALLRRLVSLRLIERSNELYYLRSDLALFANQEQRVELAKQLADDDVLWHALHLPALADVDAQDIASLGVSKAEQRLPWFRAVGRLWQGEVLKDGEVKQLVKALTDENALEIQMHSSQHAVASIDTSNRLPQQDTLAIHVVASAFVSREAALPDAEEKLIRVWLGPACASLPEPAGVHIGDAQMRDILRSPRPQQAFWASVRAQTDLQRLSPFVHSGSLPPGSPLFVGRMQMREEIAQGLHQRSFLILGARRIGKTSLLHQVAYEARARKDVLCLSVDAQGSDTAEKFARLLRTALQEMAPMPSSLAQSDADSLLDHFQGHARKQGRMPVLLLNEIDGLLLHAPDFVQRLRARHDAGRMRFVFTGYAPVLWALDDLASPLYHFTSGGGGNHFTLGQLQDDDCRELIAWLTKAPLLLQWPDHTQQKGGEDLLIAASHRLPWLLQDLCGRLLTHMTQQGRSVIVLEDVRKALAGQVAFLDRLEGFDVATALGQGVAAEEARSGGLLILHLLLTQVYGWGEGSQTRQDRMRRSAVELGFTEAEARSICQLALKPLPLLDDERGRLVDWLRRVPMKPFFDGVTLSLILGNAVRDGDHIWFFHEHIYPSEWDRAERHGVSLEDRVLNAVQTLCDALR